MILLWRISLILLWFHFPFFMYPCLLEALRMLIQVEGRLFPTVSSSIQNRILLCGIWCRVGLIRVDHCSLVLCVCHFLCLLIVYLLVDVTFQSYNCLIIVKIICTDWGVSVVKFCSCITTNFSLYNIWRICQVFCFYEIFWGGPSLVFDIANCR